MRYRVHVTETRAYRTTYIVEAENEHEAFHKAEIGWTEDESEGTIGEVLERLVTYVEPKEKGK